MIVHAEPHAGSAPRAAFEGAIGRRDAFVGQSALPREPTSRSTAADVIPRHDVVGRISRLGRSFDIERQDVNRIAPRLLVEAFRPRIEPCTVPPRFLNERSSLSPTTTHDRLDKARLRVMPVDRDGAVLHRMAQKVHTSKCFLGWNLAIPLERRLSLRHEQRARRTDLYRPLLVRGHNSTSMVIRLLNEAGDALDVVIGLGWQADHEIELATTPTSGERRIDGTEQVIFRHVLVDDIAQPLSASFGSEREPTLLLAGDEPCHVNAKRIESL